MLNRNSFSANGTPYPLYTASDSIMKKTSIHLRPGILILACLSLFVGACKDVETAAAVLIPSVKYLDVRAQPSGQTRRFSGQVQASEQASLSFGVAGQVNQLKVEVGDQVVQGQVIAKLDQRSYKLNLNSAVSRLNAARITARDAKNECQRQKKLYAMQLVALTTLEKSKATLDNAETQLIVAQNEVHQAKQDIDKTVIKAPFDAVVAERNVDRLAEVAANTAIVMLATDKSFQVRVLVPESIIRFVQYQQSVQVTLPNQKNMKISAEVNEIAASSISGNAYAVTAQISQQHANLRAGMSANISFFFANTEYEEAYLIPMSAISTRDAAVSGAQYGPHKIPLFIIDAETSRAKLIWVSGGNAVANELEITSGLKNGDRVITAGVAFIKDGMQVHPWQAR